MASSLPPLGQIHFFAATCFSLFGAVYLLLLDSRYLFASNQLFMVLCLANWACFRSSERLCVHSFLTLVYLGLGNVILHVGDLGSPMIFWGLSVPMAAGFLCGTRGGILWSAVGVMFFGSLWLLKRFIWADRVIPLDAWQFQILLFATYFGILSFIAFSFFHFQRRLKRLLSSVGRKQHDLETLVKVVCHDISNPLTALTIKLSNVECEVTELPADSRELLAGELADSVRLTERIADFVAQVRRYASAKRIEIDWQRARVNLGDAIQESLRNLGHLISAKSLRVDVEPPAGEPLLVCFDRDILVLNVLNNFLSNAIKFTPQGGRIVIRSFRSQDRIQLEIRDFGVGMPKDVLEKLGAPSAGVTRRGTANEPGLGFGVSIAKAYLDKQAGTLSFRSVERREAGGSGEEEAGTTVILSFVAAGSTR